LRSGLIILLLSFIFVPGLSGKSRNEPVCTVKRIHQHSAITVKKQYKISNTLISKRKYRNKGVKVMMLLISRNEFRIHIYSDLNILLQNGKAFSSPSFISFNKGPPLTVAPRS
jgi:hypothetical protein